MQIEFNYWLEDWKRNWQESFKFLELNNWRYQNRDGNWFDYDDF